MTIILQPKGLLDELGEFIYFLLYYVLWYGVPLLLISALTYFLYKYFKNKRPSRPHDYYGGGASTGHENSAYNGGSSKKTQLEEIYERLNHVEGDIRELRMQLGLGGKTKQDLSSQPTIQWGTYTAADQSTSQAQHKRTPESRAPRQQYTHEGPVEILCNLYNQGVENPSHRTEFKDRYRPDRIGTSNAMARRRDPTIDPEFQLANDGDYYAITEVIQGSKYYAVVPKFDLTLQESNYGPGAMSLVFQCPNYDPQMSYRHVRVVRPAAFERDASQNWKLKKQGELDLGQGERT